MCSIFTYNYTIIQLAMLVDRYFRICHFFGYPLDPPYTGCAIEKRSLEYQAHP